MAIYLLNISVDTTDPNPEYIPEDLSFNDQESIVEIVLEKVLGFENALKEYDDHDTEDVNKKKNVKIDLSVQEIVSENTTKNHFFEIKRLFAAYEACLTKGFTEIDCPPPKV